MFYWVLVPKKTITAVWVGWKRKTRDAHTKEIGVATAEEGEGGKKTEGGGSCNTKDCERKTSPSTGRHRNKEFTFRSPGIRMLPS